MPFTSGYSDYQPITWFRRMPIYVTTLLSALLIVGMVATTILESAGVSVDLVAAFWSPEFFRGCVWQLVTYPFIARPDFFFLFGVLFFYFAGIEVEKYLGRKRFIQLLVLLLLVPPSIVSVRHLLGFGAGVYAGSYDFTAALFIAFATLYPNLEYFGWVPLKWIAFACFFISSLGHLPHHDWAGLAVLWGMCGTSFGFIRFLQHGGSVSLPNPFKLFRRRPKLRVVKNPVVASAPARAKSVVAHAQHSVEPPLAPQSDVIESIDPLLDKISKHGLASLTAREREKLERARVELLKKGAH